MCPRGATTRAAAIQGCVPWASPALSACPVLAQGFSRSRYCRLSHSPHCLATCNIDCSCTHHQASALLSRIPAEKVHLWARVCQETLAAEASMVGQMAVRKAEQNRTEHFVWCLAASCWDTDMQGCAQVKRVEVQRFYRPEDISRDQAYKAGLWDVYASDEKVVIDLASVVGPCQLAGCGAAEPRRAGACPPHAAPKPPSGKSAGGGQAHLVLGHERVLWLGMHAVRPAHGPVCHAPAKSELMCWRCIHA